MKKILFLDMDETLVSTKKGDLIRNLLPNPYLRSGHKDLRKALKYKADLKKDPAKLMDELELHGVPTMDFQGELWGSKLRPGVHEFLDLTKHLFDRVYVLTMGEYVFQNCILEMHEILDYFDDVYSTKDDWNLVPKEDGYPLLVDNLGIHTGGVTDKLTAMGLISPQDWKKIISGEIGPEELVALKESLTPYFIQIETYSGSKENDDALIKVYSELLDRIAELS